MSDSDLGCKCDYSYTCPPCQARIDAENQKQYNAEWHEWTNNSLQIIAKALGVELPPIPEPRE